MTVYCIIKTKEILSKECHYLPNSELLKHKSKKTMDRVSDISLSQFLATLNSEGQALLLAVKMPASRQKRVCVPHLAQLVAPASHK